MLDYFSWREGLTITNYHMIIHLQLSCDIQSHKSNMYIFIYIIPGYNFANRTVPKWNEYYLLCFIILFITIFIELIQAVIAKQTHFAYNTPTKRVNKFEQDETPQAPKLHHSLCRRLSFKKLVGISVCLFASHQSQQQVVGHHSWFIKCFN